MKTLATANSTARSAGVATAVCSVGAVVVLVLGLWLSTGVSVRDVAFFLSFELVFVLAPGITLYRALSSSPGGWLRHVAIGGGLGYVLAILAFAATAALGIRDAYLAYPAAVIVPAAMASLRRHRALLPSAEAKPSPGRSVALAAVAVVTLVYVTAGFFGPAPLPERVDSVVYYIDLVWGVSLAADALNHFPIADPTVDGEPLKYHTFVFLHMASVAQVTGIELTTIALRLWVVPALLLLVLQLAYAGRHFTGRPWAGPVAAALLLLVGDLDLGADRPFQYMGTFFTVLFLSPTFLLGLVLFVPAIVLLHERLVDTEPRPQAVGEWILLALLLTGCAGAKGSILPIVLGGLLLVGAWRWLSSSSLGTGLVPAVALSGGLLLISYLVLFRGAAGGLELKPLVSGADTFGGRVFAPEAGTSGTSKPLLYLVPATVASITLMIALLGLAFALRRPRRLTDTSMWLLGLLCTSVVVFFATDYPGGAQFYFLGYGFAAAVFLSAGGLVEAGGVMARLAPSLRLSVLAGTVVLAALLVVDLYSGDSRLGPSLQFGLLCLGIGVMSWFALSRRPGQKGQVAALTVASGFLLAAVVDGPLNQFREEVDRWTDPQRLVYEQEVPPARLGLTAELREGLRWVRDNTPTDSVVAVNNHYSDLVLGDPRYFYYSALAERRVFLEGWGYTNEAHRIGREDVTYRRLLPFPNRLALNDVAVLGNRRALGHLANDHGVKYVLIDKVHGPAPRKRPGQRIFSNPALDVYELN
jgi:hypothetical protein